MLAGYCLLHLIDYYISDCNEIIIKERVRISVDENGELAYDGKDRQPKQLNVITEFVFAMELQLEAHYV